MAAVNALKPLDWSSPPMGHRHVAGGSVRSIYGFRISSNWRLTQMTTGIRSYQASDWRDIAPAVDHVVPTRAGLATLVQQSAGLPAGNEVRRPSSDQHCIHIWHEGALAPQLTVGDDRFEPHAPSGAFLLVPAGAEYSSVRQSTGTRTTQLVFLDAAVTESVVESGAVVRGADPAPMIGSAETRVPTLGKRMLDLASDPLGIPRVAWESLAILMSLELIRICDRNAVACQQVGGLAPWQIARVRDYVLENIAGDVGLTDLASTVGLSAYHFSRAFKRTTGLSPTRYVTCQRVERAKSLLNGSAMSLCDVARAVGYASVPSFSRAFRQTAGVPPMTFRRSS